MCPVLALRDSVLQTSTALKVYLRRGHIKELQKLRRPKSHHQQFPAAALHFSGNCQTPVCTLSQVQT